RAHKNAAVLRSGNPDFKQSRNRGEAFSNVPYSFIEQTLLDRKAVSNEQGLFAERIGLLR
ncbi:hypothetical protein OAK81_01990, partial [Verrucomicrobiales bacterium]|nr:hypothetical protein [Verrucomicrobiales bacterium]